MEFGYICIVNKTFKNISVFVLAALLVLSTTSFTVHKHFCGSFLVGVSLVVPTAGCGMEQAMQPGDSCEQSKLPGCCTDKEELIQGQDTLKLDLTAVHLQHVLFATLHTNWYIELPALSLQTSTMVFDNGPPVYKQPLYILHDALLI